MINIKHEIEIEVLTPISVGAGIEKEWIKGVDFILKDNKIYILSIRKMINHGVNIDQMTTYFADRADDQIATILGNKINQVSDNVFASTITTTNNIKTCIKNELSGLPIIPGSSLKGALRSVLFSYLRTNERNEKDVFGSSKVGDEFMRFIKLSDIEFEETELVNSKIFNLRRDNNTWLGGWKHSFTGNTATTNKFSPTGFNTLYESIIPGSKGYGSIMIADKQFNFLNEINPKKEAVLNVSSLFKVINEHTKEYLSKELEFFEKYPADKSDLIIDSIKSILSQIPADNSYCIMKMAAGSGFHSITGDWQFEDYTDTGFWEYGKNQGKKKYKSRKIADYKGGLSLMGFVKISTTTQEAIEKEFDRRRKKKEEEIQQLKKRKIEEKRLEENKILYAQLIKKANELLDEESYEEAKSLCNEAGNLFPDNKNHIDLLYEIDERLERITIEKEWELRRLKEEEEAKAHREQQISAGLSFLAEQYDDGRYKVTDFKGAKNRINSWMRKANADTIPEDEIETLVVNLKRIYDGIQKPKDKKPWVKSGEGIWRDVEKWVGKVEATRIFDKTIQS